MNIQQLLIHSNFLENNRDIIEQEIHNLQNDDDIRKAVTQAVRVKVIISLYKNKLFTEPSVDLLEKLRKFEILIPGGEVPSPDTFLPMAYEFYQSAKQKVK